METVDTVRRGLGLWTGDSRSGASDQRAADEQRCQCGRPGVVQQWRLCSFDSPAHFLGNHPAHTELHKATPPETHYQDSLDGANLLSQLCEYLLISAKLCGPGGLWRITAVAVPIFCSGSP